MKELQTPGMILFDSGGTLCVDDDYDPLRGVRAIMPYITKNPRGFGAEELFAAMEKTYEETRPVRKAGFEVSMWTVMRLTCARNGIVLGLDMNSFERVFRTAMTTAVAVPHVDELLRRLNEKGVRTGVISNSRFSGDSLTERLNGLFPDNRFEFILSSCDYPLCKPHKALFEIALARAGLPAGDVWYCGDSRKNDVAGALGAGLFPVLYDRAPEGKPETPRVEKDEGTSGEYLRVADWRELISVLTKTDGDGKTC